MDKKTVRKEINNFFKDIPDEELENLSLKSTEILIANKLWAESDIILAFLTFGKEFNTETLIREALLSGKKVAVPRLYGKEMKFHYIQSLEDQFEINRWQIKEPLTSTPFWTPADGSALILTPGLAFNRNGGRLGRGGGFYDRFFSIAGKHLYTVAICFEQQIRNDFPVEEHDYRVNAACSDQQLYLF